MRKHAFVWVMALAAAVQMVTSAPAAAQQKKPNILVIFWATTSACGTSASYTHGMMGFERRTSTASRRPGSSSPTIYGQPSCTAGRASFHHGPVPIRTGETTIGIPGSTLGIQKEDPTLAEVLKSAGYNTAQFGKNHLGDRNEFLPTVHGFDEWFGNLYHLNAEEEPEQLDYPGPEERGLQGEVRPSRRDAHLGHRRGRPDGRPASSGAVGRQECKNTGPLTRKRMETFDGEVLDKTLDYLDRKSKDRSPSSSGSTRRRFTSVALAEQVHPGGRRRGADRVRRRPRQDARTRRAGGRAAQEAEGPGRGPTTRSCFTRPTTARADDVA